MPQVIFEKKDRIAYVTINRPEKMNALNNEVVTGLNAAWREIENDTEIWCTIVTGAGGRAFSAGADLKEMSDRRKGDGKGEGFLTKARATGFWRTSDLTKPVIAAVDGYCLAGGLELAMACDFIIASDRSHFGLSEVLRAIIPGGWGYAEAAKGDTIPKGTGSAVDRRQTKCPTGLRPWTCEPCGCAGRCHVYGGGACQQDQREWASSGEGDQAAGLPGHRHASRAGASVGRVGVAEDPQDGGLEGRAFGVCGEEEAELQGAVKRRRVGTRPTPMRDE